MRLHSSPGGRCCPPKPKWCLKGVFGPLGSVPVFFLHLHRQRILSTLVQFCTLVEVICGGGILCLYLQECLYFTYRGVEVGARYTAPLTFFPRDLQALRGSSSSALDNCIVVLLVV